MPLSNIHLRGTSTETIPNANISGGSVVADLNGLAVKVKVMAVAPKSLTSSRLELRRISPALISFPHPLLGKLLPPPVWGSVSIQHPATLLRGSFSHTPDISLVPGSYQFHSEVSLSSSKLQYVAALAPTHAACQGRGKALSVHPSFIAFYSGFLQPEHAFQQ